MNLVYIAGPYRGKDITAVRENIRNAKNTAINLIDQLHCCRRTKEERQMLASGDFCAEELYGLTGKPSCPKCVGRDSNWFPVIPHMNTALFDFQGALENVPDQYYLEGTMSQMEGCLAVILVGHDAIQRSSGTAAEVRQANALGIPVFVDIESFMEWTKGGDFFDQVLLKAHQSVPKGSDEPHELVTFSSK